MMSNNKLFDKFLRRESVLTNTSLKDTEFIIKCRNEWKSMSDIEKQSFANTSVSNVKSRIAESIPKLMDEMKEMSLLSTHRDSTQVSDDQKNQKLINRLVNYKNEKELMATKFYFMSTNILCIIDNTYPPLEFGFVEYSLLEGIVNKWHVFVDCGEIPVGYNFSATNHMELTHKIPVQGFDRAVKDYNGIGKQILKFLANGCAQNRTADETDNPLIIFSMDEQIRQNMGALDWIFNKMTTKSGEMRANPNIKVLEVSRLLLNLFNSFQINQTLIDCRELMTSGAFDYSSDTDCEYHTTVGSIDCALGVARRLAFLMSMALMKVIPKILLTHFPSAITKDMALIEKFHKNRNLCRKSSMNSDSDSIGSRDETNSDLESITTEEETNSESIDLKQRSSAVKSFAISGGSESFPDKDGKPISEPNPGTNANNSGIGRGLIRRKVIT